MVSEWSRFSGKLRDFKSLLIIFGKYIDGFDNFHVLIVECALILLNSQLVALSFFVHPLLDSKLCNFTALFSNIVPNYIWSGALQPCIAPFSEVDWTVMLDSSLVEVNDEVVKPCILEGKLGKVRCDSCLENISSEQIQNLVKPSSAFSIGNSIKHVKSCLGMDNLHRDRMGRVLLVSGKTPERLIKEFYPST